ncbi:MAG: hypothetical protein ACTSW3_08080 [Promethearchaeota archaeon]
MLKRIIKFIGWLSLFAFDLFFVWNFIVLLIAIFINYIKLDFAFIALVYLFGGIEIHKKYYKFLEYGGKK